MHKDHPKFGPLLIGGRYSEVGICYKDLNWESKIVVAEAGNRYSEVVGGCSGLTV